MRSNPNTTVIFHWLFLFFSLANLLALTTTTPWDNYLTKPWLMIWLGAYAWSRLKVPVSAGRWLLRGLLFAFLGDTFLLFADGGPSGSRFFLLGLGSFLLTHISYWLAFHCWPPRAQGLLSRRPLWWLPFPALWGAMMWLLWPLPAGMRAPVVVYSLVIILMAAKALDIRPKLSPRARLMVPVGALLFVLSDAIIALSRFTSQLSFGPVVIGGMIMLTYLGGQYLIVRGLTISR